MEHEGQHKLLRELAGALIGKLRLLEDNTLSCCGVTLAQCQTLVEIGRAGTLSLGELSARMNLDNSTMSRTVNNLVTAGLCERTEDRQDRRYLAIRLTESGAELYQSVDSGMDGYYEAIFDALPEEKRAQVLESMALLMKAVVTSEICGAGGCSNE